MAATVDNLESHHSYRVIRGFSDANGVHVPFDIARVYYLYDVPGGASRGCPRTCRRSGAWSA